MQLESVVLEALSITVFPTDAPWDSYFVHMAIFWSDGTVDNLTFESDTPEHAYDIGWQLFKVRRSSRLQRNKVKVNKANSATE